MKNLQNIEFYPITDGYYLNNQGNDFLYYEQNDNTVYVGDPDTGDYKIEECRILTYGFSSEKLAFKETLRIIYPIRLGNDITIYLFTKCFGNFLHSTQCKFPVFASLLFFEQILKDSRDFPNFWEVSKDQFDAIAILYGCETCKKMNMKAYKECKSCEIHKNYLPLMVLAGFKQNLRDYQSLFDLICFFFLKTLFFQWKDEIKSIDQYHAINKFFENISFTPNPIYYLMSYLLRQKFQIQQRNYSNVPKEYFQLLSLIQFGGKYQYILPGLLLISNQDRISTALSKIFKPEFNTELDQKVRKDIKIMYKKMKYTTFNKYFHNSYSISIKNFEKTVKIFQPVINEFSNNFLNQCEMVLSYSSPYAQYYNQIMQITSKLLAFYTHIENMKENFNSYDKQTIIEYGKALDQFVKRHPPHRLRKEKFIISLLCRVFFQKNITSKSTWSISESICLYLDNFEKYTFPDELFMNNQVISNTKYFKDAFKDFANEAKKSSNASKNSTKNISPSAPPKVSISKNSSEKFPNISFTGDVPTNLGTFYNQIPANNQNSQYNGHVTSNPSAPYNQIQANNQNSQYNGHVTSNPSTPYNQIQANNQNRQFDGHVTSNPSAPYNQIPANNQNIQYNGHVTSNPSAPYNQNYQFSQVNQNNPFYQLTQSSQFPDYPPNNNSNQFQENNKNSKLTNFGIQTPSVQPVQQSANSSTTAASTEETLLTNFTSNSSNDHHIHQKSENNHTPFMNQYSISDAEETSKPPPSIEATNASNSAHKKEQKKTFGQRFKGLFGFGS